MNSAANTLIICLILLIGCNDSDNHRGFMISYISRYDSSVQKDSVQKFIIVPMYGCIGCQDEMMNIWAGGQHKCFKLLTSNLRMLDDHERKWVEHQDRVFIDSSGKLDRLRFRFGDFNLISIKDGQIIDNLPVMPDANRDSIIASFAKRTY